MRRPAPEEPVEPEPGRPDPKGEACTFCNDGEFVVLGECPACGVLYDGTQEAL